jgi:Lipopolysaccharide-assembly
MRPSNSPSPTHAAARGRASFTARLFLSVMAAGLAGCGSLRNSSSSGKDDGFFGWHFHAPFDTSEVKTVAVFFKSNVFRRDLQQMLTEAVIKEIHLRTPYRVVANPENADSLLTATITSDNKNLVVEAPTNFARELNATIVVQANWTHNPATDIEALRTPTLISETLNFVPEVGQTTLSAYNQVIASIAKQLVDMMEERWYLPQDLE